MGSIDDLTATEQRFLGEVLRRARNLERRTRGLYAESLVADALPGAEPATTAACEWDVRWAPPDLRAG